MIDGIRSGSGQRRRGRLRRRTWRRRVASPDLLEAGSERTQRFASRAVGGISEKQVPHFVRNDKAHSRSLTFGMTEMNIFERLTLRCVFCRF